MKASFSLARNLVAKAVPRLKACTVLNTSIDGALVKLQLSLIIKADLGKECKP